MIGKIKENPRIHIPVFGNGDVNSPEKALEMRNRYAVDGIMIGRASIGYPWIFREVKHFFETGEKLAPPTVAERVAAAKDHLARSLEWKGERRGVVEMRRHYTNYFKRLPNIKPLRLQLVTTYEVDEILATLDVIAKTYDGYFKEQEIVESLTAK